MQTTDPDATVAVTIRGRTITITVTAEDGTTSTVYRVHVRPRGAERHRPEYAH